MTEPDDRQAQQGCAFLLIFSGVGFVLGFAAAVVLAAWGGW